MTDESDIVERLDRLIAIMNIAFAEQIETVRTEIAQDQIAAAILAAAREKWVPSGDLQRSVSNSAGVSEKTVQRSLTMLADRGLLQVQGSGRTTSYRANQIV